MFRSPRPKGQCSHHVLLCLQDGHSALMFASDNGKTEVVQLLLGAKANVDLQDEVGWKEEAWGECALGTENTRMHSHTHALTCTCTHMHAHARTCAYKHSNAHKHTQTHTNAHTLTYAHQTPFTTHPSPLTPHPSPLSLHPSPFTHIFPTPHSFLTPTPRFSPLTWGKRGLEVGEMRI